jgi:hypothetical protein
MKNKSELMLKPQLCKAGYSEEAVEKILLWYTFAENRARSKQMRIKDK